MEDKIDYRLDTHTITVPFEVTNGSPKSVYIEPCGGGVAGVIEKRVQGAWSAVSDQACILLLMPGIEIRSGKTRAETIDLQISRGQLTVDDEYRLRIWIHVSDDDEEESLLPDSVRTSDPFWIR